MLKIALTAAALTIAIASPAFAATECTDANMKKMMMEGGKMADGPAKMAAMKEGKMAEDMMKKGDMKGCSMAMDKAMMEMKK